MLEWIKSRLRSPEPEHLLQQAEDARNKGALEQARGYCLAFLRRSPNDVHALCLMAGMAADTRNFEEGLQWALSAIAADSRAAAPHYAAGRVWEAASQYAEAESSYREAIRREPGHARAHNNLGCVLHMQGKLDAALGCYRKALELDPTLPEANQNYAMIASDAGVLGRALEGLVQQTRDNPRDAGAFNNLAKVYLELGRYQEGLECYERSIAIDPERAETHFGKAQLLLLLGDYAQGWSEYEWRWRMSAFNAPAFRFPQPMWDGAAIDGTVLIHGETGFGDMLQFVRYAPWVAKRCAAVVVECQPALKGLLQHLEGTKSVVAQGEPLPAFEAHVPLIRLPRIFGTTLESVPWGGPYVHAHPRRAEEWRALVESSGSGRFKVGLVWAGNPQHWGDRRRSMTLAALAPLAQALGVAFYSLQKGEAGAQAAAPPPGLKLVDLTARISDFSDTAALISHLDLVISVDTAVAHLVGAMGVPVWVMLAYAPEWRYHLNRSDNPWYPTMRLFRQERDGEWSGVVERVARELRPRGNPDPQA